MKIAVIGAGYVGLVTGVCLAESGNDVICVDIDEEKINKLSRGEIPFYEPGLEELFERNVKEGRLRFITSLEEGVQESLQRRWFSRLKRCLRCSRRNREGDERL